MSDEIVKDVVGFIDDDDNELDENDLNSYHVYELITSFPYTQPSDPMFQPIPQEKLLTA